MYQVQERSEKKPMGFFYVNQYGSSIHPDWSFPGMCTSQKTRSWRTGLEGSVETDRSESAVLRNGFTTFDPRYDSGHEFWTQKWELPKLSHANYAYFDASLGGKARYEGPMLLNPPLSGAGLSTGPYFPALMSSSEQNAIGSRAIAATRPLNPASSLSTASAELLADGFSVMPGLQTWRHRAQVARNAGGEYLNIQFGWLPLIADIRKVVLAVSKSNSLFLQAQRDSGRNIRRRFVMPEVTESRDYSYSGDHLVKPTTDSSWWALVRSGAGSGSTQVVDVTKTRYIFSGAYTYHLAIGSGVLEKAQAFEQKANLLLGTRITPETLWELTPWSWLVDWFANVGAVIGNTSAFTSDNLVMRYGYLQRHVVGTRLVTAGPWFFKSGTLGQASNVFGWESKERWRATPYGFGLNPSTFSARQWAILSALYLTKAPGALR